MAGSFTSFCSQLVNGIANPSHLPMESMLFCAIHKNIFFSKWKKKKPFFQIYTQKAFLGQKKLCSFLRDVNSATFNPLQEIIRCYFFISAYYKFSNLIPAILITLPQYIPRLMINGLILSKVISLCIQTYHHLTVQLQSPTSSYSESSFHTNIFK